MIKRMRTGLLAGTMAVVGGLLVHGQETPTAQERPELQAGGGGNTVGLIGQTHDLQQGIKEGQAALAALRAQLDVVAVTCAPPGTVVAFYGKTAPAGWLLCDGSAIPKGSGYDALRTLVGNTLPDLRGEFIRGLDHGRGVDKGRALGTPQGDCFQVHQHSLKYHQSESTGNRPHPNFEYPTGTGKATLSTTDVIPKDTRTGTETRPRNVALTYIIKY